MNKDPVDKKIASPPDLAHEMKPKENIPNNEKLPARKEKKKADNDIQNHRNKKTIHGKGHDTKPGNCDQKVNKLCMAKKNS